jgi:hypothetical protein
MICTMMETMKAGPHNPVNSSSNRICTQASVITETTHVAHAGPVLWDTQSVSLVVPFQLLNFAAAAHCTFPRSVYCRKRFQEV